MDSAILGAATYSEYSRVGVPLYCDLLVDVIAPVFPPPLVCLQLLYNLIGEIVGSYWLALIFQTSHVISEVYM